METKERIQEIINVANGMEGFEVTDLIIATKRMATDHALRAMKKLGEGWDLVNELTDEELHVCVYDPCEGADDYANAVVRRVETCKDDEGNDSLLLYCTLESEGIEAEYRIDRLEPGEIESVAKWLDDEYEYYEGELEECYVQAVREGYISEQASRRELEDNFDEILAFRFDDCEYGPMSREFALGILDGFRD